MKQCAHRLGFGCAVTLTFVVSGWTPVKAQSLVSRTSELSYNFVYGAGADSHAGNNLVQRSTLVLSDTHQLGAAGSTSGVLAGDPPRPYSAGVTCALVNDFVVAGNRREMHSLHMTGTTDLTAPTSGAGLAFMDATNPGNVQTFVFDVHVAIPYRLHGTIAHQGDAAFNSIRFEKFDGTFWALVQWTAFLPTGQGSFDYNGTLTPGRYRVFAGLSLGANPNEVVSSSFDVTLDVPEAGTCSADLDNGTLTGTTDGGVDINDLLYFLTMFELGDLGADLDNGSGLGTQDGGVDINDLLYFLGHFESGC